MLSATSLHITVYSVQWKGSFSWQLSTVRVSTYNPSFIPDNTALGPKGSLPGPQGCLAETAEMMTGQGPSVSGWTALHCAVCCGRNPCAKWSLSHCESTADGVSLPGINTGERHTLHETSAEVQLTTHAHDGFRFISQPFYTPYSTAVICQSPNAVGIHCLLCYT